MYRNGIKRLLAVVLSLCGMICLSWLFLILAVAIKLDSPGPVFFKQKRVGIGKKHFYILKFRTMRIDTPHDMPTHLLHDPDQYITRMGHFLRKTSLDELPQLWNIFVGDMARRAGNCREGQAGRLVCGASELWAGCEMLLWHHCRGA